jgi:hypothetical protein
MDGPYSAQRVQHVANEMCQALDDRIAALLWSRQRRGLEVGTGTLITAEWPWWYEFHPARQPDIADDVPLQLLLASGRRAYGQVVRVDRQSIVVAVDESLGPRTPAVRLIPDDACVLRGLRSRLARLSSQVAAGQEWPASAATLALVGERGSTELDDGIAKTADSVPEWLSDEERLALSTAQRYDAAFVCGPQGQARDTVLVEIVLRLLRTGATTLLVSGSNAAADRIVLALCERLAGGSELRAGVMHRMGHVGMMSLREEYAPFIDPARAALAVVDDVDVRLSHVDAERRDLEHERAVIDFHAADQHWLDSCERIAVARARGFLYRVVRGARLRALEREAAEAGQRRESARVDLEQLTAGMGRRAARSAARIVRTLDGREANERRLQAITHRLETVSFERETLIGKHDRVRDEIRDRLRLAVTTPARLCLQELPRRAFDVVVLDDAAWLPLPIAFLAAARTRRSVITLGEVGRDVPSLLGNTDLSDLWLRRDVFAAAGLAGTEGAAMHAPYVAQLSSATALGRTGSDGPCLWQHCPRGPRPVGRHAAKVDWSPCPACP